MTATPTGGPPQLHRRATRPPARPGMHTRHPDTARPPRALCSQRPLLPRRLPACGPRRRVGPLAAGARRPADAFGAAAATLSGASEPAAGASFGACRNGCRQDLCEHDASRAKDDTAMTGALCAFQPCRPTHPPRKSSTVPLAKTRSQRLGCPVRQLQDNGGVAPVLSRLFRSYEGAAPETYAEPSGVVGLP